MRRVYTLNIINLHWIITKYIIGKKRTWGIETGISITPRGIFFQFRRFFKKKKENGGRFKIASITDNVVL